MSFLVDSVVWYWYEEKNTCLLYKTAFIHQQPRKIISRKKILWRVLSCFEVLGTKLWYFFIKFAYILIFIWKVWYFIILFSLFSLHSMKFVEIILLRCNYKSIPHKLFPDQLSAICNIYMIAAHKEVPFYLFFNVFWSWLLHIHSLYAWENLTYLYARC